MVIDAFQPFAVCDVVRDQQLPSSHFLLTSTLPDISSTGVRKALHEHSLGELIGMLPLAPQRAARASTKHWK